MRERAGALSTAAVDADGNRDVFCEFEKRVERLQVWFETSLEKDSPMYTAGSHDIVGDHNRVNYVNDAMDLTTHMPTLTTDQDMTVADG